MKIFSLSTLIAIIYTLICFQALQIIPNEIEIFSKTNAQTCLFAATLSLCLFTQTFRALACLFKKAKKMRLAMSISTTTAFVFSGIWLFTAYFSFLLHTHIAFVLFCLLLICAVIYFCAKETADYAREYDINIWGIWIMCAFNGLIILFIVPVVKIM